MIANNNGSSVIRNKNAMMPDSYMPQVLLVGRIEEDDDEEEEGRPRQRNNAEKKRGDVWLVWLCVKRGGGRCEAHVKMACSFRNMGFAQKPLSGAL